MRFLLLLSILFGSVFGAQALDNEAVKAFMNAEHEQPGSGALPPPQTEADRTVRMLLTAWSRSLQTDAGEEKYAILSQALAEYETAAATAEKAVHTVAAELMGEIVYYCRLSEKISYGKKSKAIYEAVLADDPDCFAALLGLGIGLLHTPKLFGGNPEKAFALFTQAEAAADEPYRRYLAALWISQYYSKTGNEERCRDYFSKAAAVYPEGWLLKRAAARNAAGKTL